MTSPDPLSPVELNGMTWDHSRGFLPMVAAGQRFEELHPNVRIHWDKRSLKDFEEYPLEKLAERYDLIVLDHPFVGYAAAQGPLLALDAHLPEAFLAEQRVQQVGGSHDSYAYAGHQWALALDAAAPVAFWREDLMEKWNLTQPQTWEALIEMALAGHVEIPSAPIYALMNFYALCLAHGEEPFADSERIVSNETGRAAIRDLRTLIDLCDPGCRTRNPIHSHELMAAKENQRVAYCPLAYGYSNYARQGYAANRLTFGAPPSINGHPLRTTLGGTGLGLSALRPREHRSAALAFAQFVADGTTQRHLLTPAGGQPGHRTAWLDAHNNALSHDYFKNTLATVDAAWMRPRYLGYARFQAQGGPVLHAALTGEWSPDEALDELNQLYRESRQHADREPQAE